MLLFLVCRSILGLVCVMKDGGFFVIAKIVLFDGSIPVVETEALALYHANKLEGWPRF